MESSRPIGSGGKWPVGPQSMLVLEDPQTDGILSGTNAVDGTVTVKAR